MEIIKPRSIAEVANMTINGVPAWCAPKNESISVEEVFSDIINKYTEAGALLAGLRHREGMTQCEFSSLLNITQANLSAMENGKRSIGKELAKRIANKFKLDYRIFL